MCFLQWTLLVARKQSASLRVTSQRQEGQTVFVLLSSLSIFTFLESNATALAYFTATAGQRITISTCKYMQILTQSSAISVPLKKATETSKNSWIY